MLPPMVAPLRIRREANSGHTSSSSGTAPSSPLSTSDRVSAAPTRIVVADHELAQLGQPVDGHGVRRPGTAQVDLDAPVGRAGDDGRVGVLGQQRERLGQVGRAGEAATGAVDPGRHGRRRRGGPPARERVVVARLSERPGRVADRAVAGAAAEVAAHRVQVEAVRAVLVVLHGVGAGAVGVSGRAGRAVELGGHAAHEAGCAVAALGAAAVGHLALDRVQHVGAAETFGGDDLLAVERRGRHQAGVDGGPLGAVDRARAVRAGDQDRAGAALTLGAALLGTGQAEPAQEVERRGVRGHASQRAWLAR